MVIASLKAYTHAKAHFPKMIHFKTPLYPPRWDSMAFKALSRNHKNLTTLRETETCFVTASSFVVARGVRGCKYLPVGVTGSRRTPRSPFKIFSMPAGGGKRVNCQQQITVSIF